jgi:hypothetical protein
LEEAGKFSKTWNEVKKLAGNIGGDASQMPYVTNETKGYTTNTTSEPARGIRDEFVEFYIAVDKSCTNLGEPFLFLLK